MINRVRLLIFIAFFSPAIAFCQQDTLTKKLDSLSVLPNKDATGKSNNINPSAYNDSTKFTLKNYFVLLGSDFKQQITAPFHATGKDWTKVAVFGGITAGVSLLDKSGSKFFSDMAKKSKTVSSVSNFVTSFGGLYEVYSLTALTAYGFIFKNEKIKSTAFLASQAYITAGALQSALKYLTKRQRPNYIDPKTNTSSPKFHGPFYKFPTQTSGLSTNSSFPSGHTTVAFAAATVYAMEYRHIPWIPVFSYTFATVVGVSRMIQNKHWPTDVLVGAALGILSGRQVVNNYHRYMKIKQPERPQRRRMGSLSFSLEPFEGKMLPGFTYNF